jgi:hypothetical protein
MKTHDRGYGKGKIQSNPICLYREAAAEVECWLAEEKHHPDGCGGGVEREATTRDERGHAGEKQHPQRSECTGEKKKHQKGATGLRSYYHNVRKVNPRV